MCYYTFLNEKQLQRYTFFMIYANFFGIKSKKSTTFSEYNRNSCSKLSYFASFSISKLHKIGIAQFLNCTKPHRTINLAHKRPHKGDKFGNCQK